MKKRCVALYARSAVAGFGDNGIKSQLAELRAYCEKRSWAVTADYSDAGQSRQGIDSMLEAIQTGSHAFDAILVRDIQRISRDTAEVATFMNKIDGANIELVVPDQLRG